MSEITQDTRPMALREPAERYTHVVLRLQERAAITWTVEQVQALEKKIKTVRMMINQQRTPALILPQKIGEDKEGSVHYYRVLIATAPHTFVWSQVCRGLISYRGPGELAQPLEAPLP